MSHQETIYVVTVNYNNASHTCTLFDNLASCQDKPARLFLVIVDNASSPSDVDKLTNHVKDTPWVQLIQSRVNGGYFKGLNIGLDHVPEAFLNKVIICNNDITFESDFFANLMAEAPEQGVLVLAPQVTTINGRHQNPHVVSKVSPFRLFCYDLYFTNYFLGRFLLWAASQYKKVNQPSLPTFKRQEIYMGIGACYILTNEFFVRCKRLDDRVFLWGEEALLAGQVKANQGKTIFCPALKVLHHENASVATIPSRKAYEIMKKSYSIYRPFLH